MVNFNIRTKLSVLLLVFGTLPLAGVMPIIFNKLDEMEHDVLKNMNTSAGEVSELIDRNLFERYGDVQAFTTNAATKDIHNWYKLSPENPLIASMDSYMANYGVYKLMLLVDMEGQVAAVNSVDNKGKPLSTAALYGHSFKDASWFQKVIRKDFLKGDGIDGTVVEQPHYEPTVAEQYKGEDGFTIAFAAPAYDYSGKMIGVWANFVDFGLIENIVKHVHEQKKEAGFATAAFAIEDERGIALVNYDPTQKAEQRDPSIIGKKSLESLGIPAAAETLKTNKGAKEEYDPVIKDSDAVGWEKSSGALGFPGLGWTAIMHEPSDDAFASIKNAKKLLLLVSGVTLVAILAIGSFIGSLASRPLRKISEEISRLASGDFSKDLEGLNSRDELGQMAKSLNSFIAKMRETIGGIIESAQAVNAAANEISAGSTDLSQRTEEQASSLEETAASMEEITGTVKHNSANAASANDLSSNANKVAMDGGKVVEEAVSAMGNIERSSKKISDIIGVIDEIAFQTNLLALNAAVEAARAGDAGKGFAVVASEVRSLAGRSASASKEIKALISESAAQVQTGAELVNQAGDTLQNIVSSVQKVAQIVSEIAAASQEQAIGIEEVNTAVTQMDEVTQQNAALVEENTAAAQSMVEQAHALEQLMSFFTISENNTRSASDHEHREKDKVVKLASHKSVIAKHTKKPVSHISKTTTAGKHAVKPSAAGGKGYGEGWEEF